MEAEKEFSKEELRRQLYSSLQSTGVLDSMKGQLRARLLEHLRQQNSGGGGVEVEQGKKPSLTERLLSSLFLEYLEAHGFTFTISVFMPESHMASWPPFSYHEMLKLLHLNPSIRRKLQKGAEGRGTACLAYQLVTVLQQMAQPRGCIQEVSTQTFTSTSSPEVVSRKKGVEHPCSNSIGTQSRLLPYRSLEDKITLLHHEFDARVNAEVASQVSRLREFEIHAARMDEAARYRRQLASDREELEDSHKARLEHIKAREESLLERMLFKEKAIEAFAFEQRQKILTEITGLRERKSKLRQFKESQEHREEKLDERELSLRAKEEEVVQLRQTLYAQADDKTTLCAPSPLVTSVGDRIYRRKKELEELCDRLHHDRSLLEAEREQMKEERAAMTLEIAASRGDKELIQALQHCQSVGEDQRLTLVKTIKELEEKLKQQQSVSVADKRLEELQAELEKERLQRQASEKESKTLERELQQKKVELAARRSPRGEWIVEHKNLLATIHQQEAELHRKEMKLQLMETERVNLSSKHRMLLRNIDHLETLVKKAQEGEDRAICNLEILQVQHTVDERELLETVMILRKAQRALEAERLENRALRSHMNAVVVPSISAVSSQRDMSLSQGQLGHMSNDLFDHSSSANQAVRTKWESSNNWKPKRESHDLWSEYASSSPQRAAAASLDQKRDESRFAVSKSSFSSGFGNYQLLDLPVTNTESLLETVVNGSIEEYFSGRSSWEQDRYSGPYRYEDAIPSWRKTYLPEVVAGPEVKGVCSSSRDPGPSAGEGDGMMRWDMAHFQGGETKGPTRKLDDSAGTCVERKGFVSLQTEEKSVQAGRSTESSSRTATTKTRIRTEMEIEFQERPASNSVDEHEKKPTNNEQSPSRGHALTTSTTTQTNMDDLTSVEDNSIRKHAITDRNDRTSLDIDNRQQQYYTEPSQNENLEEDKTRQATQERELGTTDEEPLKLTNKGAKDVTPVAPQGTPPPTTSTHCDSDMRDLGSHTTSSSATHDEQKTTCEEEEELSLLSYEKLALSLSQAKITGQNEEPGRPLVDENQHVPASGKMSGLPEMMFQQEIHAELDNLQDQHSADEKDQAHEAPANYTTVADSNQQVEDEPPKLDGQTTPLGSLNEETPITVESSEENPRRVADETSNMQQASRPTHPAAEETRHSSNDDSGSVYKGDSFEEEEDDVDEETTPTYSEVSCTNEGMNLAQSSEQTRPGSLKIEQSFERVLAEPSENWNGASEQGSYSPDEDESVESVETCMTQGTTEAHGEDQALKILEEN